MKWCWTVDWSQRSRVVACGGGMCACCNMGPVVGKRFGIVI